MVGSGTAASCTEAALAEALTNGGVIRFNCGGPTTIAVTSQITLRTDVNTTIDGGGQITLDGGGKTRLFYFFHPDWQRNKTIVTLQNITLQNAQSTGTAIAPAPVPCSQGVMLDGGGAAIFLRDGILHIWNSTFKDNTAAAIGPDVAGGAIYALGSLETTIVDSTFQTNRASNGGAVGGLYGNVSIYDSHFASNLATGNGANDISKQCTAKGGQIGNGGNGGGVLLDGAEIYTTTICGSTFTGNAAGADAFGGAVFRSPEATPAQTTIIDRSFFSENSATNGGALFFWNSNLVVTASTFAKNTALQSGGALSSDASTLNLTNDTFANNTALKGLGGGIFMPGSSGAMQNDTFLDNQTPGGSGYVGAAIANINNNALSINNSLFDKNTTLDCGSPMACIGPGLGFGNLQWPRIHVVCTSPDRACATGTNFSDPQLGTLADNGGPTPTAAPGRSSPALEIGQNCPPTDQRGVPRPANGCTVGATQDAASP
jgi:predicted outer membrane repeat protein